MNKHIKNYYKQKLFKFYEVKLIRANSECLGTRRRRRTRLPAKSDGELDVSYDPSISEWGNPTCTPCYPYIGSETQGSETSQYLKEKKDNISIP